MSLEDQIKKHEGLRLRPYYCIADRLTIGYGRNLEDCGISQGEADYLLANDIETVRVGLSECLPWILSLSPVRQAVLINMAFNLGINGLLKFKKMLAAVYDYDYVTAAEEMLDSRWAKQVGYRAEELAEQMRTGDWSL